jgi:hypothetical protein
MSRGRVVAVLLTATLLVGGCARKKRAAEHGEGQAAAAAIVPTPDTTPIEILRTPAGLVLKTGPEPTGTPVPEGTTLVPTPAAR